MAPERFRLSLFLISISNILTHLQLCTSAIVQLCTKRRRRVNATSFATDGDISLHELIEERNTVLNFESVNQLQSKMMPCAMRASRKMPIYTSRWEDCFALHVFLFGSDILAFLYSMPTNYRKCGGVSSSYIYFLIDAEKEQRCKKLQMLQIYLCYFFFSWC